MPSALSLQHVAFEDLDCFSHVLHASAYSIDTRQVPLTDFVSLDPLAPDLLVILGGPIGVYEGADYPFLETELAWLRRRLDADLPTLGICLGCQLIAAALGARVYPSGVKELGWSPLQLSAAGAAGYFRHLADTPVLHWHGDTFDLPAGAELLASSSLCRHQAFRRGRALGLQFHPEVSAAGLERWLVGHTLEIRTTPGLSVSQLRADNQRHAPLLQPRAEQFLQAWLAEVAP